MSKKAASRGLQRVYHLLGVPFDVARDLPGVLSDHVQEEGLTTVFTPNPEILMKTFEVQGYREILAQADVSLPDGTGLYWATSFLRETEGKGNGAVLAKFFSSYARLVFNRASLKKVLPRLHHGSDTFFALHELWNKGGSPRVYYFGGEEDVPDALLPALRKKYPGVHIVGNCGGYPFRSNSEYEEILQKIEAAKPEVLFVGLPFPKQEQWVARARERLEKAGIRLVMIGGGTLDFAVGKKKRAPQWMRRAGMEWFWRLLHEPARIGRIWTAVFAFPLKLLSRRLAGRKDLTFPSSSS